MSASSLVVLFTRSDGFLWVFIWVAFAIIAIMQRRRIRAVVWGCSMFRRILGLLLGFIVERQRRIDAFVAEDFWQIGITVEKDGQARFALSVCVRACVRACLAWWFACRVRALAPHPSAVGVRSLCGLTARRVGCLRAAPSTSLVCVFVCLCVCVFALLCFACLLAPSRVCLFDCFRSWWFWFSRSGRALQLGALPPVR